MSLATDHKNDLTFGQDADWGNGQYDETAGKRAAPIRGAWDDPPRAACPGRKREGRVSRSAGGPGG